MLHRAPDLFVSGDARLVGVVAGGEMWLQRQSGASAMTRDFWLRAHGLTAAHALPGTGEEAGGAILCVPGACRLRPAAEGPLTVLLRGDPPGEFCGRVELVVSAEPLRGHCDGSQVIDRFSVWRDGPHAVWFEAGAVRVVSDRAWRGERPWVPPMPIPRAREALPSAPTE
jgi:competence protein ComEC